MESISIQIYLERVSITVKAIRTEEVLAFCQKALTLFKQKHGLRRSWTDVIAVVNLSKIRLLRLKGKVWDQLTRDDCVWFVTQAEWRDYCDFVLPLEPPCARHGRRLVPQHPSALPHDKLSHLVLSFFEGLRPIDPARKFSSPPPPPQPPAPLPPAPHATATSRVSPMKRSHPSSSSPRKEALHSSSRSPPKAWERSSRLQAIRVSLRKSSVGAVGVAGAGEKKLSRTPSHASISQRPAKGLVKSEAVRAQEDEEELGVLHFHDQAVGTTSSLSDSAASEYWNAQEQEHEQHEEDFLRRRFWSERPQQQEEEERYYEDDFESLESYHVLGLSTPGGSEEQEEEVQVDLALEAEVFATMSHSHLHLPPPATLRHRLAPSMPSSSQPITTNSTTSSTSTSPSRRGSDHSAIPPPPNAAAPESEESNALDRTIAWGRAGAAIAIMHNTSTKEEEEVIFPMSSQEDYPQEAPAHREQQKEGEEEEEGMDLLPAESSVCSLAHHSEEEKEEQQSIPPLP
eukprot:scaffold9576_cov163-Ochromonas_danica.AAC.1